MLRFFLIVSLFSFLPNALHAGNSASTAKDTLTVDKIWRQHMFRSKSPDDIQWLKAPGKYTTLEPLYLLKHDAASGNITDTLLDIRTVFGDKEKLPRVTNYAFSPNENRVLLATATERIYRYSRKSDYYIYNFKTEALTDLVTGDKERYATFSPDGQKIAFFRKNDLYYRNLSNGEIIPVTSSGKEDSLINGGTDWVYEEEFQIVKGFRWGPDSKKLAFYRFDESHVKQYTLQYWRGKYPDNYKFKYPKAGERNAKVSVHIHHLNSGKKVQVNTGNMEYIPRIKWTNQANKLAFIRINRLQNHLQLLHANAKNGKSKVVMEDSSDTYVTIDDDLTYLENNKGFLWTSEKDGYNHLYHYSNKGKLINQVTTGNWEVDKFLGVDESRGTVYYTSTEKSPLQRHFYRISLKGTNKKQLSSGEGYHSINLGKNYKYYFDAYSKANQPQEHRLFRISGNKKIRTPIDNENLKAKLQNHKLGSKEFFSFTTDYGVKLNGWMIKPPDFDPNKNYPVLMNVYGGPGVQTVLKKWNGFNYMWHQLIAQKGYIIVSVDNRGTGGRGAAFKKQIYGQLGKLELQDLKATAKYLSKKDYVDGSRIGIWGWSYGGYLSSLAATLGSDQFSLALAVAPVTNWLFYDTIYSERFLKTPKLNPEGYRQYSPLYHADKLDADFMLVHGMADDNVHMQHSIAMQQALINANKQFRSFYYPNRNHGIYGGNARLHLYNMMTEFVTQNL